MSKFEQVYTLLLIIKFTKAIFTSRTGQQILVPMGGCNKVLSNVTTKEEYGHVEHSCRVEVLNQIKVEFSKLQMYSGVPDNMNNLEGFTNMLCLKHRQMCRDLTSKYFFSVLLTEKYINTLTITTS